MGCESEARVPPWAPKEASKRQSDVGSGAQKSVSDIGRTIKFVNSPPCKFANLIVQPRNIGEP